MKMSKFLKIVVPVLLLLSMVLSACAQAPAQVKEVIKTVKVIETKIVEVAGTPEVKTETKIITATPEPEKRELLIFNWWTGPGEKEAADAMYKAYNDAYPDVTVVQNPVPGGGGVNLRTVLQARFTAGLPPDTFQTLGGAELKNYVDSGILQPLDDLWKELDYANVIPGPLAKAVTVDGHPYVVPLNMHIQNILYYDKKLFTELGIEPPTTYDELVAACDKIKAAKPDLTCISQGSKEKWEDAFMFDSMYLEQAGAEAYVKLYKGETDVNQDPAYKKSLENLAALVKYMNPDHSSLTWDQAVGYLGQHKSAMTLMGTWAIGALKSGGMVPGEDFGAVTFPQKPDQILLFHPDTYGLAVGAPDPSATMDWLRTVASPELQVPTDVTQGGLFARTDIDPGQFPDPIRQVMQKFVAENPGKLILDQHGSILPATAQPIYWDILSSFLVKPDVAGTIKAVSDMMTTYDVKNASSWYQWP
jgi:glucose/mannose transport system substrate-binding protein